MVNTKNQPRVASLVGVFLVGNFRNERACGGGKYQKLSKSRRLSRVILVGSTILDNRTPNS